MNVILTVFEHSLSPDLLSYLPLDDINTINLYINYELCFHLAGLQAIKLHFVSVTLRSMFQNVNYFIAEVID